jgi:hypothetical protein
VASDGEALTVESVAITGLEGVTPPVRLPRRVPLRAGGPYTAERVAAMESLVLAATRGARPSVRPGGGVGGSGPGGADGR